METGKDSYLQNALTPAYSILLLCLNSIRFAWRKTEGRERAQSNVHGRRSGQVHALLPPARNRCPRPAFDCSWPSLVASASLAWLAMVSLILTQIGRSLSKREAMAASAEIDKFDDGHRVAEQVAAAYEDALT